ncbi:MAG TPA: addiction module protein [Thermoanaerobaculia bacterium]|nr:addiction module protein [Thermoanaerobaculia bacterium]
MAETDEEETDRIWAKEAERRYQELRRGEVEGQDSDEVFREARARLK